MGCFTRSQRCVGLLVWLSVSCYGQIDLHPKYHFRKEKYWMNDICGPFFWKGYYHVFYQNLISNVTFYGDGLSWGHIVSTDMVYWTVLPPILLPYINEYDYHGAYDGSAFLTPYGPMVVYAGNPGTDDYNMNLAWPSNLSDPFLIHWTKADYNSIMPHQPDGYFWALDPTEVWDDEQGLHHFLVGAGHYNYSAVALMYTSTDYVNWVLDGQFLIEHDTWNNSWYCNEFFALEDMHVYSTNPIYAVGTFDNGPAQNFTPILWGHYDDGQTMCSKSFWDWQFERRVAFLWLPEGDGAYPERGWSGAMSLPRVLSLNDQNEILSNPIPELEKLRRTKWTLGMLTVAADSVYRLPSVQGMALEIQFNVSGFSTLGSVGARVLASTLSEEYTPVGLWPALGQYGVSRTTSSKTESLGDSLSPISLPSSPDASVRVRVFVDVSVIEVYVNDGLHRMTTRVYPTLADSVHVDLFAASDGLTPGPHPSATFTDLTVWEMASIWD